ncbi:hypothetical protein [Rose yellow vein virus]|uniref:Uncharacterized protein n=1 Tax=Rose yellow vein virus TaxID=1213588 RepID=I7CPB4_9VIRU|nr:hypothetical protein [Rose yellow vein virus]AFO54492.1 hypothetical protein [Rose yellow vein virus]
MDMLILEEQLLQLQIKKAKLLAKGKNTSSSSEESYKDQILKPQTKLVKLGSVNRAQGNPKFPESPMVKSLATTELVQDIGQSSRQQTARRKDKSNPLKDSSYPKGEIGLKPKTAPKGLKPKPAVVKEQSSTVQTVSKPKRWMPNNKRPVNPDQHQLLNNLMSLGIDVPSIRTIEKALYQANKIEAKPKPFNSSIKPILVNPEVEIPQDQMTSTIPLSEVQSFVFPSFYYQKNRWNQLFESLNEAKDSSVFLYKAFGEKFVKWEKEIEIIETYGYKMINVLSNSLPAEIFSELFMDGFINGIKLFWNFEEMFNGSPPEVISFLSFIQRGHGLTEDQIKQKTSFIKVLTAPPLLEEQWRSEYGKIIVEELIFLAPRKYPSVHLMIEDHDLNPISFDARKIDDEEYLSPVAKRRAVTLQQIEAFIYSTKVQLDFQLHCDLERIICYRLKPSRFARVNLEQMFEDEAHFIFKQAHFSKTEEEAQSPTDSSCNPFNEDPAQETVGRITLVSNESASTNPDRIKQAATNRQAIFGDSPFLTLEEHVEAVATSKVSNKM